MASVALRRRVYEIIEPGIKRDVPARGFEGIAILMIVVSVAGAICSTVPDLGPAFREELHLEELICGWFFVFEYAARLWTTAEHPVFGGANGRGVIAHMLTPLMLLDAAGLVPLLLVLARPQAVAPILIFQVLRFFRLARYSPALATVGRVLSNEWRPLLAAGLIGLGLLLVAATGMYLIEHEAQPQSLGSIPQAMYWAVVTVVTVGYGDVVPITPWGKVFTGFVMLGGLIFFALPVAIIATGFLAEIRRRDFIVNYGMVARVPAFAGLDGAALAELVSLLRARKFPPHTIIIRKGDEGDSMYFIASGEVEVVLPHSVVRLQEGDFFGEVAVLGRIRRTATVIARRHSELLVLDAADVVKFMDQNPRVATALREKMAERVLAQDTAPA
jgi:voltage-gated potassium channel